jgi:hypothetical protein
LEQNTFHIKDTRIFLLIGERPQKEEHLLASALSRNQNETDYNLLNKSTQWDSAHARLMNNLTTVPTLKRAGSVEPSASPFSWLSLSALHALSILCSPCSNTAR